MIPISIRINKFPLVSNEEYTSTKGVFWWLNYLHDNEIRSVHTCEICTSIYLNDDRLNNSVTFGIWSGNFREEDKSYTPHPFYDEYWCCTKECFKKNVGITCFQDLNVSSFIRNINDEYISNLEESNEVGDNSWKIILEDNYFKVIGM